jgi:hypothetical protein
MLANGCVCQAVKLLIADGADVLALDGVGDCCVKRAVELDNYTMLGLLLVSAPSRTPCQLACVGVQSVASLWDSGKAPRSRMRM